MAGEEAQEASFSPRTSLLCALHSLLGLSVPGKVPSASPQKIHCYVNDRWRSNDS